MFFGFLRPILPVAWVPRGLVASNYPQSQPKQKIMGYGKAIGLKNIDVSGTEMRLVRDSVLRIYIFTLGYPSAAGALATYYSRQGFNLFVAYIDFWIAKPPSGEFKPNREGNPKRPTAARPVEYPNLL